jgi:hypothetical protein
MAEPEIPLGGSHSRVVRVGQTVRRVRLGCGCATCRSTRTRFSSFVGGNHSWSSAVQDLLRHLDREGFAGAPRALGFDDQGREVLTYIEGEVGRGEGFIPDQGSRFDGRVPDYVWHDDVLVHLGALIRAYHDAAATFPWAGREWMLEAGQPVETVCHNELFPQNTVFRAGVPVAFIDWDTAAPGSRAWDLGFAAWRWVPFFRDEKCRAHRLPTGIAEKARRFRLFLAAYGLEPDVVVLRAAIERMREFLGQLQQLVADGSEHEVEAARRGALDELALEIAWVEEHAVALVES